MWGYKREYFDIWVRTLDTDKVARLAKEIKKYINTYRLQSIYIVQAMNIYKPALNIMKYMGIYSMINSDSKVSPKADNVNAERKAEAVAQADCAKTDSSTKAV